MHLRTGVKKTVIDDMREHLAVEILKKEEFGCELSFLLKQRLEEALGGPEDGRKAPPTMEE